MTVSVYTYTIQQTYSHTSWPYQVQFEIYLGACTADLYNKQVIL